jgi:putative hydrolase of HD superfamily
MVGECDCKKKAKAVAALLRATLNLASMPRWNDKIRPAPLWELDKQSHKAMLAFLLGQTMDSEVEPSTDLTEFWEWMRLGILFEVLLRSFATDLKPSIQRRIEQNPEDRKKLIENVQKEFYQRLEDICKGLGDLFKSYLNEHPKGVRKKAMDILSAAHLLATNWEVVHVLRAANPTDPEMAEVEGQHSASIREIEVRYPALVRLSSPPHQRLVDALGRLRFQRRWRGELRFPETTVLGHSLMVAILVSLVLEGLEMCHHSRRLTVFTGLFHDLPEALVRDIARDVRKEIDDVVKRIEREEMTRLLAGLDIGLERYLRLFTGTVGEISEFKDVVVKDGFLTEPKLEQALQEVDISKFPGGNGTFRWGSIVNLADLACAYVEARNSLNYGVESPQLRKACEKIRDDLQGLRERYPQNEFGQICELFSEILNAFDEWPT